MRSRRDPAGMHVLITGAASGIGAATARLLAARGARLYLTDVNDAGLQAVAAETGAVLAVAADVGDHAAVTALAARVHEHVDALDAVCNVAGIAIWGTVLTLSHEQWRQVIDVNLMGSVHVVEAFVPAMVTAGRGGHLVNVASAAALIGMPWHAAYSASKFGVRGMSEVLRFDLARHGIAVTLVCPGGVDTPLTDSVQIAGVDAASPVVQRLRARFRRHAVTPEHAAAALVEGMLARRYLVYTSPDIRAIHAVQRYVPPVYAGLMHAANRAADRVAARA